MLGGAWGRFICFQISIQCRGSPEECLCAACVCICIFPDYDKMSGRYPMNVVCFLDLGLMLGGAEECLYDNVIWLCLCVLFDMLICMPGYAQGRPDARRGPMPGMAQCSWAGPMICLCDMCMVCGSLGSSLSFMLTVFSFGFWYFRKQREELGMTSVHTPCF